MNSLRNIIKAGVLLVIVSCAYDNAEELYGEPDCPQEGVSFSNTIAPIINSNCAVPGCHVNGTPQPAFMSYEQISANAFTIKTYTSTRIMPPAGSGYILTQKEIDDIACWVDNGAPDN
jgi:hypothetical protein